jgi:hypothetical protein
MKKIKLKPSTSAKELAMLFSGAVIPVDDMEEMIRTFAQYYAVKYYKDRIKFEGMEDEPGIIGWNNGEFYKD